jgi:Tfp pilus assembly protein PilZ
VRYTNTDGLSSGLIRDISLGGVFILSRRAFSLGQSLSVSFSPTDFEKTVWITGDVMIVTPEGIGVRFRSMNEIQKTAILSLASRRETIGEASIELRLQLLIVRVKYHPPAFHCDTLALAVKASGAHRIVLVVTSPVVLLARRGLAPPWELARRVMWCSHTLSDAFKIPFQLVSTDFGSGRTHLNFRSWSSKDPLVPSMQRFRLQCNKP